MKEGQLKSISLVVALVASLILVAAISLDGPSSDSATIVFNELVSTSLAGNNEIAISESAVETSLPIKQPIETPASAQGLSYPLAEMINGRPINSLEVQNYINWHKNFSSLQFKDITDESGVSVDMKVGNFNHRFEGFIIDSREYAFELVACDERTKGCSFKINGIDTEKIYSSETNKTPKTFSLNDDYEIKINSIVFNFCDHKRFCDAHFEAYDLVDVEIKVKK